MVDDGYIDRHFGVDSAQYERESAFVLLKGGNIGLCTMLVRNVKSEMKPGKVNKLRIRITRSYIPWMKDRHKALFHSRVLHHS